MTAIMDAKQIAQEFKNLNDRIDLLTGISTPDHFYHQMQELAETVGQLNQQFLEMWSKFEAFKKLNTPILEYTDEEMQEAWKASGVTLKEMADKFKIEIPSASRRANGHISDKNIRHETMQFFLERINAKV